MIQWVFGDLGNGQFRLTRVERPPAYQCRAGDVRAAIIAEAEWGATEAMLARYGMTMSELVEFAMSRQPPANGGIVRAANG